MLPDCQLSQSVPLVPHFQRRYYYCLNAGSLGGRVAERSRSGGGRAEGVSAQGRVCERAVDKSMRLLERSIRGS